MFMKTESPRHALRRTALPSWLRLSESERRAVFFLLAELLDRGVAAENSKAFVAGQHGLPST
jgi:hypothetical protein